MVIPTSLLLVEDNPADAYLLTEMLKEADEQQWQIAQAKSLRIALEYLRDARFDVILLDLSLPDSKGLNTVTQIREAAQDLPIVVLTGTDDQELSLQALARGAQDYLVKEEITTEVLVRAIRYAIERGRILKQLHAEVLERKRSEQTLRLIVEGTASVTGEDFFRSLVRSLAEALNVRYAFISECVDSPPTRGRAFAFWNDNDFAENFEYSLHGTPCEHVFNKEGYLYCREQVQSLFPEDEDLAELQAQSYAGIALINSAGKLLGHLAVLDDNPLENEPRNQAILKIFAARATAEMERQQAEKALERLAEIGELASMIVHEVRNPLTTVLMGLNSFTRLELPERFQTYLSLALEEADRLQRLLNQILLYAKPQMLDRSEVDLNGLINEVLNSLSSLPASLGKQFEFVSSPIPIKVAADKDKLKQVLINLVSNAFEAIAEGEVVTLKLEKEDASQVCIQVHNGGEPIPPEVLPQLTKPFYTTKSTGNGLGLAIVKRIVEAHGGKLEIKSAAGAGTTIKVQLPLKS